MSSRWHWLNGHQTRIFSDLSTIGLSLSRPKISGALKADLTRATCKHDLRLRFTSSFAHDEIYPETVSDQERATLETTAVPQGKAINNREKPDQWSYPNRIDDANISEATAINSDPDLGTAPILTATDSHGLTLMSYEVPPWKPNIKAHQNPREVISKANTNPEWKWKPKFDRWSMGKQLGNQLYRDRGDLSSDWRPAWELLKMHTGRRAAKPFDNKKVEKALFRTRDRLRGNPILIAKVKEPAEWTTKSLLQYVSDLTSFRPPRTLNWRACREDLLHTDVDKIGETLETLLNDPYMRKVISPEACYLAQRFLQRHSLLREARNITDLWQKLSINLGTVSFNLLMRKAAREKNLFIFTWLLQRMTRRGLKPNSETWRLFASCVESRDVKAAIFQEMRKRQLLDTYSAHSKALPSLLISEIPQLPESFYNTRALEAIIPTIESRYGFDYLRLSEKYGRLIGNILLHAVQKHMRLDDGLRFIRIMQRRHFKPDSITLNTMVSHCLRKDRQDKAFEVLEVARSQWRVTHNQDTLERLFIHAWRRAHLNVCNVLWKVACFDGMVTFKMRKLVLYSLRVSAALHDENLGVEWHLRHSQRNRLVRPLPHRTVFTSLVGKLLINLSPVKHHALGVVRESIAECLARSFDLTLDTSLPGVLFDAQELDLEWQILQWQGIDSRIEQPLPIPTRRVPKHEAMPSAPWKRAIQKRNSKMRQTFWIRGKMMPILSPRVRRKHSRPLRRIGSKTRAHIRYIRLEA